MFRFEDTAYLYLLFIIPVLVILRFLAKRDLKSRLRKYGDIDLVRDLAPNVSKIRPDLKFILLTGVLALIILVLSRPQFGSKINQEKRQGIEIMIALDISNSMMAEDVAPSRLDRAKMIIENMIEDFDDDKVGLVVFAGDAFVQLPITNDYVSAKMFLNEISPELIASQGTDISKAIKICASSFTAKEGVGRAIILITDGEDHEGGVEEAAEEARKKGASVFVLGVGSLNGAPIPMSDSNGYLTDNTGQTVISALNEAMCKEIASTGNGAYIHVENNSNVQDILNAELEKLAKSEMDVLVYSEYDEQFQAVCFLALLLLIIETCILERRNPLFANFSLFKKRSKGLMVIAGLCLSAQCMAQTDRDCVTKGNKLFREGNYVNAETLYRKGFEKNSENPQILFNLGNALLAQNQDSAAVAMFEKAAKFEKSKWRKAQSFHNAGVICQKHRMYQDAIEMYKKSLRLNPGDDTTRYNLELCKRLNNNQNQNKQNDDSQKDNKGKSEKNEKQEKQEKESQPKRQQQENRLSKENAEQLLNAAIQQEKATQDKMKKAMQQPRSRKLEKNW